MTKLIGSAALTPGGDSGTDLITKGDLHGYSSSNTRIPVGDNDQVLTADSSEALGLKWATPASSSLTTNVQTSEITSNKDISNRKNPNPTWSMSTDGSVLAVYSKISSGTCTMIGNMCNHVITEIY